MSLMAFVQSYAEDLDAVYVELHVPTYMVFDVSRTEFRTFLRYLFRAFRMVYLACPRVPCPESESRTQSNQYGTDAQTPLEHVHVSLSKRVQSALF
jgi:hypothetical protein